ncbi:unnamed protein product [Ectocarpus sp. CCAP 1310/34]|nr:unnamed protein product [Ectocarpus sp. CCAP 1310/34]
MQGQLLLWRLSSPLLPTISVASWLAQLVRASHMRCDLPPRFTSGHSRHALDFVQASPTGNCFELDARGMETPFPWLPMLALAIGLVSHSYSFSSLFPYVGYMVQHLGVTDDRDEAGYYAGCLASAFMVGRFATSYFWGRFADRYGRLPVVYIGLSSIGVLSLAFGLSTAFWWALTCRFLLGAMNALMGISKCMISEICGKQHETVGMGYVTGCSSFGLVIGPAFGGLLAQPATHYPNVFSESGLFGRYPYLLPNVVGASIAFSGLPMVFFFLKETLNLDDGRSVTDSRVGFDLVATPEPSTLLETQDSGMEEGRGGQLEMAPLTQSNSLDDVDDDDDDDEHLAELLEERSEECSSARATVSNAAGGDGGGHRAVVPDSKGRGASSAREKSTGGAINHPSNDRVVALGDKSETARKKIDVDRYGVGNSFGDGGSNRNSSGDRFLQPPREAPSGGASLSSPVGRSEILGLAGSTKGNKGYSQQHPSGRRGHIGDDLGNRVTGFSTEDGSDASCAAGESQIAMRTSAVWRECLVPVRLLEEKRVRAILVVYCIYSVLSLVGVGMLTFQLVVYPWLSKRIGVTGSQRWACFLAILVYAVFPFLSRLRGSGVLLVVGSIVLNFFSNVTATAVFTNVALATNNAVEPSRWATLNGLSMMLGSLAKAVGPAFFSAIFAWSIDDDGRRPFPLDYHLVFYLLALR